MTRRARAAGVAAVAVAVAACTSRASTPDVILGLAVPVPDGFEVGPGDDPAVDGTEEVFLMGGRRADGTSVGITITRVCGVTDAAWADLRDAADAGEHSGWDGYRPTHPPVPVTIEGAQAAVRVRGTFSLPAGDEPEPVTLVHDELMARGDDVVHRVRVEGTTENVDELPLDDLFSGIRVASTDCPV